MTFAARQAINWTEQGLVPDAIIRGAIRRLLRARLSELRPDDAAHAAEVTARFAADMMGSPIAPLAREGQRATLRPAARVLRPHARSTSQIQLLPLWTRCHDSG